MNKETFKILGIQLGIFLIYQFILQYCIRTLHIYELKSTYLNILVLHWVVILILMIVAFVKKKSEKGIGYILSFIIIVIIGFGTCASMIFIHGSSGMTREEKSVFDSTTAADSIKEVRRFDSMMAADSAAARNLRMNVKDSIIQ